MLVLAIRRSTVVHAIGIWAFGFLGGLAELTDDPSDRRLYVWVCMGAVMGLSASLVRVGLWKQREFSLRPSGTSSQALPR